MHHPGIWNSKYLNQVGIEPAAYSFGSGDSGGLSGRIWISSNTGYRTAIGSNVANGEPERTGKKRQAIHLNRLK
jgi:hypothetical protein